MPVAGDSKAVSAKLASIQGRSSRGGLSKLAQRGGDGQAGAAEGGEEAADQADEDGPHDALHEQVRRHREGEGDLAEAFQFIVEVWRPLKVK